MDCISRRQGLTQVFKVSQWQDEVFYKDHVGSFVEDGPGNQEWKQEAVVIAAGKKTQELKIDIRGEDEENKTQRTL